MTSNNKQQQATTSNNKQQQATTSNKDITTWMRYVFILYLLVLKYRYQSSCKLEAQQTAAAFNFMGTRYQLPAYGTQEKKSHKTVCSSTPRYKLLET